jgi:hypothetical protein
MKILFNLFLLYLKPSKYIMTIYVYFKFIKLYKEEARKEFGEDVDTFRIASKRLIENTEEFTNFLETYSAENIKLMFFISLVFWIGIFKLVQVIIF